jgi:hypothetical protein
VRRYAKARSGGKEAAAAMVAEIGKLMQQLPTSERIQAVGQQFKTVQARLDPYLTAIRGKALQSETTAPELPAEVLAGDGSDVAFIDSCLKAFETMRTAEAEVVGDLFEGDKRVPNALGRLTELMQKFSTRWADLTPEQMKSIQPVFAQFGALSGARAKNGLYEVGFMYDAILLLRPLGKTPAERLSALAAKNQEVAAELKRAQSGVRAWPAVDGSSDAPALEARAKQITAAFQAAAKWYGRLADFASLDNQKLRGELYQAIYASNALKYFRSLKGLPPAPETLSVNGASVQFDGRTIVLNAASLPKVSAQMAASYAQVGFKPVGELQIEFPKDPALTTEVRLYEKGEFYDVKMWQYKYAAPVVMSGGYYNLNLMVRRKSPTGKMSLIEGEPGITIIVLP